MFYKGLAKTVEKYVTKGDKLYVEGKLRYRFYDDKKGVRKSVTEIYADSMELLSPKKTEVKQEEQIKNSNVSNEDNVLPF